ncbi:formate/nitrite transporter family protein [Coralliovum pocilloporae]|uniref:formate/nitrite transporter family protein n=1 Tax=Coralliovum pocilloporae TaxID=3066369 RepID=UPI0033070D70
MTLKETVLLFSNLAEAKSVSVKTNPLAFLVLAMKAGAYVGVGILLIFSVGQGVDASIRPLVMGASFGIALTLVVFAGAELFTGHTMYMTIGWLTRQVRLPDLFRCWGMSWVGNLAGAGLLALLFIMGGGGLVVGHSDPALLHAVAAKKMNAPALELIARAILCNWLVCLALWCSSRSSNDVFKCIIIFWCLYAFIAAGFEHSVANMTVFSVALLSDHPETITLAGAIRNLAYVTLGNALSGSVIMGLGYWLSAAKPVVDKQQSVSVPGETPIRS